MSQAQIAGKKIFITGGAGFIGSTLVQRLVHQNEITVYDNFRRDALSGSTVKGHDNLRVIAGDVLDSSKLADAMAGHEIVVHCAAIAGTDTVIKRPTETMRINMIGTALVLDSECVLRVYLRNEDDRGVVADLLESKLNLDKNRVIYLHGNICRRELVVEIDGIKVDSL